MPIFDSLRNAAGSIASSIAGSPVTGAAVNGATQASQAVRGLRMPGVGVPGAADVAASPITGRIVNGAISAGQSISNGLRGVADALPTIDPNLIDNAKTTASNWMGNVKQAASGAADAVAGAAGQAKDAAAGLRAGPLLEGDAGIPTLTNVIQPGMGPHAPVPDIPTLTDVLKPGHPALQNAAAPTNPNFAGSMSPERAAYNAEQAAQMGQGFSRPAGTLAGGASRGAAISDATTLAEGFKPVTDVVARGLRAAQPALKVASKLGEVAAPLTVGMTALHSAGEDYDKRLGMNATSLAGNIGTRALGTMADLGNNMTFGLADRVGNAIAGNGFGHSSFYNSDSANNDIVGTHYGAPTAQPAAPGAPAAPAAPSTPDDITEFNNRMQQVGANSISMRAGPGDSRVIGNTAPASKEMQDYTANQMADRTAQVTAADNSYREQAARQHAQTMLMQDPDVMRLTDELAQAQHSGSPAAIQAIATARDNMIRTKSGDRQNDTQANVTMRGQDVTDRDNARSTSATIMNGMRQAAIAQRQYRLESAKFGLEQDKTANDERERAEKGFTDQLGKMFTTRDDKGNVVPDAARVGDAAAKIKEEIGARLQDLQAVPKDSPHYAEAQRLSSQLSGKGLAALDDSDKAQLMSQLAIRDRVKQTHGMMPGSSKFVDSRLGGYEAAGTDSHLLGSDSVNLRNGGNVRMNDLRYVDPANSLLPDFKQRTDQFNAGLGMRVK